MNGLTTMVAGGLDDSIAIEVLTRIAKVDSKGRTQGVLTVCIGICVKCCRSDSILSSCLADSKSDLSSVCD